MSFYIILFCQAAIVGKIFTEDFSYDSRSYYGPTHWGRINNFCDGSQQSPINIETKSVVKVLSKKPLILINGDLISYAVNLSHSKHGGHGATFQLLFDHDQHVAIIGGPLDKAYILDKFHIHFASEHTVNGNRYDAELHFVFFNEKYKNVEKALSHSDGLAVLTFFYDVGSKKDHFISLVNKLIDINEPYDNMKLNIFTSINRIIGSEPIHVWSYPGSLTVPGCNEVVTWMISTKNLYTTNSDIVKLRIIDSVDKHIIHQNYRPIQKLNRRQVLEY